MFSPYYRSLFVAVSLVAFGCASTTLSVPNNGAANSEAPTMPVAQNESALSKDFDPWADEPAAASDPHAHHHGTHSTTTEATPSAPPAAAEPDHRPETHDHE